MKKATVAFLFMIASLVPITSWAQEGVAPGGVELREPAPSTPAKREDKAAPKEEKKGDGQSGLGFIAVALAIGLAALGGGIGQGLVGSGAIAGVARNPGSKSAVQTLLLLTLVLIESLVIYALVMSLLLYAKL